VLTNRDSKRRSIFQGSVNFVVDPGPGINIAGFTRHPLDSDFEPKALRIART
jgi:hypothetical protein